MGVGAAACAFVMHEARAQTPSPYAAAFGPLDRFVEQYLREMNAPGMTLALADARGVQRVCAYGLDNLAVGKPVDPGQLFHIGSITKSVLGLCLMQLHDEGKLDLNRPIRHYLPWVRFDPATREICSHDLLTHSAALPDGPLFPADPAFRHRATAPPGTFFHYCNMGFEALGHLLAELDGRPLAEAMRARVLGPLGMTATDAQITLDTSTRTPTSYSVALNDRPYPRFGKLAQAQPIAYSLASGCIAAPARDMGAYLTMLINRGANGGQHIASESGFNLFATRHMPAKEFGADAFYGYGIVVDTIDGHQRLRHTGGMLSFASALEVDLDAGVGVFASVNAMQGFRPRPVAEYALRLMRACKEGAPLPAVPAPKPSIQIEDAFKYAGRFFDGGGGELEIVAEGDRLFLLYRSDRVRLEPSIDHENAFTVLHPDFDKFPLVYSRAVGDSAGPFVEVGWGEEGFVAGTLRDSVEHKTPPEWRAFAGHYRNEDPWIGSYRVVIRRGKLWLNGVVPLEAKAGGRFYLRDEADSPEWVSFSEVVNGQAMRMILSGADLTRV